MKNVAVAGGSGDVGRTMVEVLRDSSRLNVFVLSRNETSRAGHATGHLLVDYADRENLTRVLESHKIEIVISCLSLLDEATSRAEINLIQAANDAAVTRRFIASQWSIPTPPDAPMPDMSGLSRAALAKTDLEYTTVTNGHFSDYFGYPYLKTYLRHADFVIDMTNKVAAIPGSGDDKVVLTYSFDVAKFVLELVTSNAKWPHESVVIGDVLTLNELVRIAEDVRGDRFTVHHDDMDKLKTFQVTELPSHMDAYHTFPKPVLQSMFATFGQWIVGGYFDIPSKGSLNEMFPHVQPRTVRGLLESSWGKHS